MTPEEIVKQDSESLDVDPLFTDVRLEYNIDICTKAFYFLIEGSTRKSMEWQWVHPWIRHWLILF